MGTKLGVRVAVFAILIVFLVGGGLLWWYDAASALNPQDKERVIFVISPGESVRSIATRLKHDGIIKDQIAFFIQVKLLKRDDALQAGDFRLRPSMNLKTVIEELTHGTLDVWLTTLEGWRAEEIALKLAQEFAIPESEFLKNAREGYMFPDTYLLPKDASASAIASIFLENFHKRIEPDIRGGIEAQGLTFDEGIILSSIVEREGRSDSDRPVIAGILLKRFKNDWPLQADATIQYALGYQPEEKTWWKKQLIEADKHTDSSYNTYSKQGLPPTPIANPGLAAIRATAFPDESSYWYYLHDREGTIHYAETLEEHEVNITQYLR